MLEKTLDSPLDCKEIQPVHPEGDQSWVFIGRTDAEAETPIIWPLMRRADSFEKTLMLGKGSLKLNIQKTKIMASGPITSWQLDGETVADFFFLGSKITADCDCSHEIKRRLLLGRKVMTNLDSILKSRDITLPTKVRLVKAMVFPVVMYECESWTIKKAEC